MRDIIKKVKRSQRESGDSYYSLDYEFKVKTIESSIESYENRISAYIKLSGQGYFTEKYLKENVLKCSDVKSAYEMIEFYKCEINRLKSEKRIDTIDSIIEDENN